MGFNLIDIDTWKRREHYTHYLNDVPCSYSVTANIDISALRENGIKLYPAMLYAISAVVNRHEEFRMSFDGNGKLGCFDLMHPCYTVFHEGSELFSNIWTVFDTDYDKFRESYENDIKCYGNIEKMDAKPSTPESTFPVSMIPWTSFTGFNLNLQKGYDYLLPIFTMGRFFESNDKTMLPISIQVHHAVCDAFHVSRFINELQEKIKILAF